MLGNALFVVADLAGTMAKRQGKANSRGENVTSKLKCAHEDPIGLDDNEAWDYVARFAFPDTSSAAPRWPSTSRELLAKALMNAASKPVDKGQKLGLLRMAESLMGSAWVELSLRPGTII